MLASNSRGRADQTDQPPGSPPPSHRTNRGGQSRPARAPAAPHTPPRRRSPGRVSTALHPASASSTCSRPARHRRLAVASLGSPAPARESAPGSPRGRPATTAFATALVRSFDRNVSATISSRASASARSRSGPNVAIHAPSSAAAHDFAQPTQHEGQCRMRPGRKAARRRCQLAQRVVEKHLIDNQRNPMAHADRLQPSPLARAGTVAGGLFGCPPGPPVCAV